MRTLKDLLAAAGLMLAAVAVMVPVLLLGIAYGSADAELAGPIRANALPLLVALAGVAAGAVLVAGAVLRSDDDGHRYARP